MAPYDWSNGDSVGDYGMVPLVGSWYYCRQWVWEVCEIPLRLPMNDGAMETVEHM